MKKRKLATTVSGSLRYSDVHLRRYVLHKLGKTPEEIAQMEGVKRAAVEKSIVSVDAFREANTVDVMNGAMVDTVIGRKRQMDKALDEALEAKIVGKEGEMVPDHKTRLSAITEVRELVRSIQPKAQGNKTVIAPVMNQQTAVQTPTSETKALDFESRIRIAREKIEAHNRLPPPPSIAAPEASEDYIEEVETVDVGSKDTEG
jgi:hypothetical protein